MGKVDIKALIGELYKAFNYLNRDLFQGELPEPVILIQSKGNRKLTLGWCTMEKVWKNETTQEERYEINLVAEGINRGLIPVITTLLQQMVHLYNLENGIKDTSRGFTYYNKNYKEVAVNHGLNVEYGDKVGWGITTMQQSTIELVKSYRLNQKVFTMGRLMVVEQEEEKKKRNKSRKYICPKCDTVVRSATEVNILCGDCRTPFILANPQDFIEAKYLEEETELDDGAGNMIPVKQFKFN